MTIFGIHPNVAFYITTGVEPKTGLYFTLKGVENDQYESYDVVEMKLKGKETTNA